MRRDPYVGVVAIAFVAAIAATAGCGDEQIGGGAGGSSSSTAASTTTAVTSTTGATTSTSTTASGAGGGQGGATSSASTGAGGTTTGDCITNPSDPPCDGCMKMSCCAQLGACAGDAECTCWFDCMTTKGMYNKCFDDCGPAGTPEQGIVACMQDKCSLCEK